MENEDLARLFVQIDANLNRFEKKLDQGLGYHNRTMDRIERRSAAMVTRVDAATGKIGTTGFQRLTPAVDRQLATIEARTGASMRRIDTQIANVGRGAMPALGVLGAALATGEAIRYADAWTTITNKLAAAGAEGRELAERQEEVYQIAQRTRSALEPTADLYAKLTRSAAQFGRTQAEVARVTEIVNKGFVAGGATTTERASGILQLSQGLGSGRLQGDELRSLLENAPLLTQAIADGFNVPLGKLKELGEQGVLVSDQVFQALLAGGAKIDAQYARTTATVADGVTAVTTALTKFVGEQDRAIGASAMMANGLIALSKNVDTFGNSVLVIAGVIAAVLIGRALGPATAALAVFGIGLNRIEQQMVAGAVAMRAQAAATAGWAAAMRLAGGPVGLAITAAAIALTYFSTRSTQASASAKVIADAMGVVEGKARAVGTAADEAARKLVDLDRLKLRLGIEEAEKNLAALMKRLDGAWKQTKEALEDARRIGEKTVSEETIRKVDELFGHVRRGELSADEARNALARLREAEPAVDIIRARFEELLVAIQNTTVQADKFIKKLNADKPRFDDVDLEGFDAAAANARKFEAEQERIARLTKHQLALEKERLAVKKEFEEKRQPGDLPLTAEQIDRIARTRLAGEENRSNEGKKTPAIRAQRETPASRFAEQLKALDDETEALRAQYAMLNQNTVAQEANRIATEERHRAERDLADEARRFPDKKLPTKLTPDQIAEIDTRAQKQAEARADLDYGQDLKAMQQRVIAVRAGIEAEKDATAAGRERAYLMEAQAAATLRNREVTDEMRQAIRDLAKAETDAAYAQQERAANDRIFEMQTEIDVLRLGILAKREDIIVTRELARARRDGSLTPEREAQIRANAAQEAATERQLAGLQSMHDLWNGIESNAASAIASFASGMESAESAGRRLLQSIIEMVIQSALVGKNLGGSGGGGSLLSSAFSAVSSLFGGASPRAGGGPVMAGIPYVVGEKRPELFVPEVNGRILPQVPSITAMRGGGRQRVDNRIYITHDLRGAAGNEEVARIARRESEISTNRMAAIIDKQFAGRYQQMEADGW